MNCEQCGQYIPGTGHSCLIVMQKVTKDGYTFYQCDGGQEVDFHNWQHWYCCHEHMCRGVKMCILDHHSESSLKSPSPGNVVNLHRVVLGSKLMCKYCGVPLTDVAYRICITMATPYNFVPDSSQDELGEWCCSFDHCVQSAVSNVNAMNERYSHE